MAEEISALSNLLSSTLSAIKYMYINITPQDWTLVLAISAPQGFAANAKMFKKIITMKNHHHDYHVPSKIV